MTDKELKRLAGVLAPLQVPKMPLAEPPPRDSRYGSPLQLSKVHWVRPEVVVEVTYLTWTEDNLLRQVSYQGQREDKPARQVVRLFRIGLAWQTRASAQPPAASAYGEMTTLNLFGADWTWIIFQASMRWPSMRAEYVLRCTVPRPTCTSTTRVTMRWPGSLNTGVTFGRTQSSTNLMVGCSRNFEISTPAALQASSDAIARWYCGTSASEAREMK